MIFLFLFHGRIQCLYNLKNNMDHTEALLILDIAMFLKYDIFIKLIWKNSTFLLCLI